MNQVCKLSKYTKDHPECTTTHYVECSSLNVNNDCKNYKEKWFVTFIAKIIAKKESRPVSNRFEILDL